MFDPTLAAHMEMHAAGDLEFELVAPLVEGERLLGSGLLAGSVLAARRTVDHQFRPVATAMTFARAGDPTAPVRFSVTPVHRGRSVAVVVVRASQGGRSVAVGTVRFHDERDTGVGRDWPADIEPPSPAPGECRADDAAVATMRVLSGFEVRGAVATGVAAGPVVHPFWVRPRHPLPDGPGIHDAVVALLTDIGVTVSADPSDRPVRERRANVTLDHSVWWHRASRADGWLMIHAEPVVAHAGRALARGTVRDGSGCLVASFNQEILLRSPR